MNTKTPRPRRCPFFTTAGGLLSALRASVFNPPSPLTHGLSPDGTALTPRTFRCPIHGTKKEGRSVFPTFNELPREFTIMADFGTGCCIWVKEGGSGLDLWGFPKELCDRAEVWLQNYFEDGESRVGQTREQYNQEGRAIAGEVKRILGPAYTVKYRFVFPRRDSQGDLQWETVPIE